MIAPYYKDMNMQRYKKPTKFLYIVGFINLY